MFKKTISTLMILTISGSLYACRQNPDSQNQTVIKGIDVHTSIVNGDTYVNVDMIVQVGNLKFPHTQTPVRDPDTGAVIGDLSLAPLQDGTNQIGINVNYTVVSKMDPTLGRTLPNGREIPRRLQLGQNSKAMPLIGIPILENSRVYIGGDLTSTIIAGVAIGIPALDSVMVNVPIPLNLFLGYPFSNELLGVAGIYTSPLQGQNGAAIFVKKLLTPTNTNSLTLAETNDIPDTKHLNIFTRYKLLRLMNRNATLRVK